LTASALPVLLSIPSYPTFLQLSVYKSVRCPRESIILNGSVVPFQAEQK